MSNQFKIMWKIENDNSHGGRKERVCAVVDCCWRQLFFKKFWLAVKWGRGEGLEP